MVFTKDFILAYERQEEAIRELTEQFGPKRADQMLHGQFNAINRHLIKTSPDGITDWPQYARGA